MSPTASLVTSFMASHAAASAASGDHVLRALFVSRFSREFGRGRRALAGTDGGGAMEPREEGGGGTARTGILTTALVALNSVSGLVSTSATATSPTPLVVAAPLAPLAALLGFGGNGDGEARRASICSSVKGSSSMGSAATPLCIASSAAPKSTRKPLPEGVRRAESAIGEMASPAPGDCWRVTAGPLTPLLPSCTAMAEWSCRMASCIDSRELARSRLISACSAMAGFSDLNMRGEMSPEVPTESCSSCASGESGLSAKSVRMASTSEGDGLRRDGARGGLGGLARGCLG
mmetsp:Transcript_50131/g.108643  ORF Transcript_50131/g.108643 Transcript_50131/m.108643 type:complete len:291 (-) Transcript_50131:653-1525(-)